MANPDGDSSWEVGHMPHGDGYDDYGDILETDNQGNHGDPADHLSYIFDELTEHSQPDYSDLTDPSDYSHVNPFLFALPSTPPVDSSTFSPIGQTYDIPFPIESLQGTSSDTSPLPVTVDILFDHAGPLKLSDSSLGSSSSIDDHQGLVDSPPHVPSPLEAQPEPPLKPPSVDNSSPSKLPSVDHTGPLKSPSHGSDSDSSDSSSVEVHKPPVTPKPHVTPKPPPKPQPPVAKPKKPPVPKSKSRHSSSSSSEESHEKPGPPHKKPKKTGNHLPVNGWPLYSGTFPYNSRSNYNPTLPYYSPFSMASRSSYLANNFPVFARYLLRSRLQTLPYLSRMLNNLRPLTASRLYSQFADTSVGTRVAASQNLPMPITSPLQITSRLYPVGTNTLQITPGGFPISSGPYPISINSLPVATRTSSSVVPPRPLFPMSSNVVPRALPSNPNPYPIFQGSVPYGAPSPSSIPFPMQNVPPTNFSISLSSPSSLLQVLTRMLQQSLASLPSNTQMPTGVGTGLAEPASLASPSNIPAVQAAGLGAANDQMSSSLLASSSYIPVPQAGGIVAQAAASPLASSFNIPVPQAAVPRNPSIG